MFDRSHHSLNTSHDAVKNWECHTCFSSDIPKFWKFPLYSRVLGFHPSKSARLNKVKSAYEPSGPSGRGLSRFLYHEATRSISTGWDANRSQGFPKHYRSYVTSHFFISRVISSMAYISV